MTCARAAWVSTCLALVGCSFLTSLDGFSSSDAADAGATRDAAVDASSPPIDAAADGDARPSNGCVGTAGPDLVRITDELCIDATEVTNAHYAGFLGSHGEQAKTGELPAGCAFKTDHVPLDWPRPSKPDHPVNEVDWCDAFAYCKWAGKSLCGRIGGGAVAKTDATDPAVDAWYRACSANGARTYPYGSGFDPSRCNGPGANAGGTRPVKSFSGCVGGVEGLFDMSGNVQEWEDSCSGDTGRADNCADRGGAWLFFNPDPEIERLKCSYRDTFNRDQRATNLGFRCCSR